MNGEKSRSGIGEAAMLHVAASRYDSCHATDSFTDLSHRARFSKEDRRLMEDWLVATKTVMEIDDHDV